MHIIASTSLCITQGTKTHYSCSRLCLHRRETWSPARTSESEGNDVPIEQQSTG
jgi:hypothetical protein